MTHEECRQAISEAVRDSAPCCLFNAPQKVWFGTHYVQRLKHVLGGLQCLFRFENGRGASVIRHRESYGGDEGFWELAVLDSSGALDYSTPITSDVLGGLTDDDVACALGRIEALERG